MLEASFNAVADIIMSSALGGVGYTRLSPDDKALQFISYLCHQRKDIRLGGVICLYLLLKSNEFSLEMTNVIADEILQTLKEYHNQEKIYIVACLEVIGFIGPCQTSLQRISTLKGILIDSDMCDL
jgi:hypothetical protein